MNPLYLAVAISFFVGTFGYILYYFGLRPFLRYRRIKQKIATTLNGAWDALPAGDLRQSANNISQCYHNDLPGWFQLHLQRRQESPLTAAKHLMALANTKRRDHAETQMAKIRESLNLK